MDKKMLMAEREMQVEKQAMKKKMPMAAKEMMVKGRKMMMGK